MKHLPKIFLATAIIAFAIGATNLAENLFFYLGRPVGAIAFVAFLIFRFLQKETELYDAEQARIVGKAPAKEATRESEPHGRHVPAHA